MLVSWRYHAPKYSEREPLQSSITILGAEVNNTLTFTIFELLPTKPRVTMHPLSTHNQVITI